MNKIESKAAQDLDNMILAWRNRWAEWNGEPFDKRKVEWTLAGLPFKQLAAIAAADIKVLSSVARKILDSPLAYKPTGLERLYKRADRIAGRSFEQNRTRKHCLFTKTKETAPELKAAQKHFATQFKQQSRRYVRTLLTASIFRYDMGRIRRSAIPAIVPGRLVEAKRAQLKVHRLIKEKQK